MTDTLAGSASAMLRPPRPHTSVTTQGRRVSEVLTYQRRGSELSAQQEALWQRLSPRWWIPDEATDCADFDATSWFDRPAPLVVEIGSGVGEATAVLAAAHPEVNILAFEIWRPGVAQTFRALERYGVDNVRLLSVDAVWSFEHLLPVGSVAELWTFFPDPWPKNRHRRRRLVQPDFAASAASRLAVGALWRLATDWPDYASQMRHVLVGEALLRPAYEGATPRWADRPVTRFELRALRQRRSSEDLVYRRV